MYNFLIKEGLTFICFDKGIIGLYPYIPFNNFTYAMLDAIENHDHLSNRYRFKYTLKEARRIVKLYPDKPLKIMYMKDEDNILRY